MPQDCAPAGEPGNLHDTQQCVQAIAQAGYLQRLKLTTNLAVESVGLTIAVASVMFGPRGVLGDM
jgi:hypothetical protein